jgi:hypothetical protein
VLTFLRILIRKSVNFYEMNEINQSNKMHLLLHLTTTLFVQ